MKIDSSNVRKVNPSQILDNASPVVIDAGLGLLKVIATKIIDAIANGRGTLKKRVRALEESVLHLTQELEALKAEKKS